MFKRSITILKKLFIFILVISIVSEFNSNVTSASDILNENNILYSDVASERSVCDDIIETNNFNNKEIFEKEQLSDSKVVDKIDNNIIEDNYDDESYISHDFEYDFNENNIDDKDSGEYIEDYEYIQDTNYDNNESIDDFVPIEGLEVQDDDVEIVYDCDEIYDAYLSFIHSEEIEDAQDGFCKGTDYLKEFFDTYYNINNNEQTESAIYNNHIWDRYSSYYAYNHLSANEKIAWLAMDSLCYTALTSNKNYSSGILPYVSSSSLSSYNSKLRFYSLFKYSMPQYYFLSSTFYYTGDSFTFALDDETDNGTIRAQMTEDFKSGIDSFLKQVRKSTNDADTVKSINNVICNNTKYVLNSPYNQSAYSVFVNNKSVCAGYTLATNILCNYFDVECMGVTSKTHAWNKVNIGDNWYNLDTTWNDTGSSYTYFLKSDASIKNTDHTVETLWTGYIPKCSSNYSSSTSGYGHVAKPEISYKDGKVTITCETIGADIYYTMDGVEPSESYSRSYVYSGPFSCNNPSSILAIAVKDQYKNSLIAAYNNEHKINYILNGGINNSLNPYSYKTSELDEYLSLYSPSREYYDFEGWYTSSDFDESNRITEINTISFNDFTLYAKWRGIGINISLDVNGGNSSSITNNITLHYDEEYGILPEPTRLNYEFDGWYTEPVEGHQITSNTIINTPIEHTLYAHWFSLDYYSDIPKAYITSNFTEISANDTTEVLEGTKLYLSTESGFSKLYYTLDGSIPNVANVNEDNSTNLYSGSITLCYDDFPSGNVTIKVISHTDYSARKQHDSEVVTYFISIKEKKNNIPEEILTDARQMGFYNYEDIPNSIWVVGIRNIYYTGSAITFDDIKVYDHTKLLTLGKDYTIKYKNNINAGKATVIINGKGDYNKNITRYFNIMPLSLNNSEKVNVHDIKLIYNAKVQKGTTDVLYSISNDKVITLKEGKDFKYLYDFNKYDYKSVNQDNKILIKGIGNFCDECSFNENIINDESKFCINKLKINKISTIAADGSPKMPAIIINNENDTLIDGVDYNVKYYNNVLPGTGVAIVEGIGNYYGSKKINFTISAVSIKKFSVIGLEECEYTGAEITQNEFDDTTQNGYKLYYIDKKTKEMIVLKKDIDYDVEYSNNILAGKAYIIFKGKNKFTGTLRKAFSINPRNISSEFLSVDIRDCSELKEYNYQKGGVKPIPQVIYKGELLEFGKDFTCSYAYNGKITADNTDKLPLITIKGKGNYSGKITGNFKIIPKNLNDSGITIKVSNVVYTGKVNSCKPSFTLYDNGHKLFPSKDYNKTIIYKYLKDTKVKQQINKKYITITRKAGSLVDNKKDIIPNGAEITARIVGINNYNTDEESYKDFTFRYISKDISKAKVSIPSSVIYNNKPVEFTNSDIKVSFGSGKNAILLDDSDYEIISYKNNSKCGVATVTIRGINNYGGNKTIKFKIIKKSFLDSLLGLNI